MLIALLPIPDYSIIMKVNFMPPRDINFARPQEKTELVEQNISMPLHFELSPTRIRSTRELDSCALVKGTAFS